MDEKPSREQLLIRAKLAETAERYDDLKFAMKSLVEIGQELNNDERNSLSTAYRFSIAKRRVSWRVISSLEQKEEDLNEEQQEMVIQYREKIEREIAEISSEVTNLIDKYLLPKTTSSEAKKITEAPINKHEEVT